MLFIELSPEERIAEQRALARKTAERIRTRPELFNMHAFRHVETGESPYEAQEARRLLGLSPREEGRFFHYSTTVAEAVEWLHEVAGPITVEDVRDMLHRNSRRRVSDLQKLIDETHGKGRLTSEAALWTSYAIEALSRGAEWWQARSHADKVL